MIGVWETMEGDDRERREDERAERLSLTLGWGIKSQRSRMEEQRRRLSPN
jgi:hypothetical protein